MTAANFLAVRSAGGLLPMDTIGAVVEGKGLDGLAPGDYHLLTGETLRGEANRAWQRLLGAWRVFNDGLDALPEGDPAIGVTRERWLLPLFAELGYGRLDTTPAGGLVVEGQAFSVSHIWRSCPIHLLGAGVDLDRRSSGVAGAAKAAPHAMVQELLNRTDDYLWAFLSNGRTLRLLRDNASLVRQAYLEFDLTSIFDGQLFSEFVALFLLCHQSRVEARDDTGPRSCWLETWRSASVAAGTRALDHLRDGVARALRAFGSGFLRHPANHELRSGLASGVVTPQDYYRSLLRLAYRLLFVFVAEDRNLLHRPDATPQSRDRYARYFSTARLRRIAVRGRSADRHPDLWRTLQLIFEALGRPEGLPALGLPYLGGFLFDSEAMGPLRGAELANADLLAALRPLALVRDATGLTRTIDYRNLDSEELGSVYESLLQLVPSHDPATGEFRLVEIVGNERKTTGSYYTPSALIASLLDSALEPLLDDAVKSAATSDAAEAALLELTVCDPACGSGHFLVAAARRIAKRVAAVRTSDPEPAPEAVRTALRDVVGRCVYGVDVNDLAAELAKVSLWLEALDPGKPLSFLDAKIKVGNALLGATPALLAQGIPDDAFAALTGDDKKHTADLKKRNRREREDVNQGELFGVHDLHHGTGAIAARRAEIDACDDASPAGLAARADAWRRLEASHELRRARLLADAWCAALVWPKTVEAAPAITDAAYRELEGSPDRLSESVREEVARLARDYRFFHWHLEFPEIFQVPDELAQAHNESQGWTGGFTAVLGNPPWERVKLQEQEFFAARAPEIASAPNAAARRRLISALAQDDPRLMKDFEAAKRRAEGESHLLRNSGRYPLCGRGDINTYAVFAEADRNLLSPRGRAGVIVPTGIATDATTQYFFKDVVQRRSLVSYIAFKNERFLFPKPVEHTVTFGILTLLGAGEQAPTMEFCWNAWTVEEAALSERRVVLTQEQMFLLNPNTGTCPVFRTQRDADISVAIYEQVPILIRDGDPSGNPWDLSFSTMFHMSNDSHLFHSAEQLEADGWVLKGNRFCRGQERMLPLFEAKMIHQYDHRWATYDGGETRDVTLVEKADPGFVVQPRYWVSEAEVTARLASKPQQPWLMGWRDICRSTDVRTTIATVFPRGAVGNKIPLLMTPRSDALRLQANLSSFCLDFVSRQKMGGATLNYFLLMQFPVLPPHVYQQDPEWLGEQVGDWIRKRQLELLFTTWDMEDYARAEGDHGPPFLFDPARRSQIQAELDAAYFHLYGLCRDDTEYMLDTFLVLRERETRKFGEYVSKRLVLEAYDGMAKANAAAAAYETVLVPAPGDGPRHAQQRRTN